MAAFTLSIHAPVAAAAASGSSGAPLRIEGIRDDEFAEVTFYCNDHALAADLAAAINAVVAKHRESFTAAATTVSEAA